MNMIRRQSDVLETCPNKCLISLTDTKAGDWAIRQFKRKGELLYRYADRAVARRGGGGARGVWGPAPNPGGVRKGAGWGKGVELGGRRSIKKKREGS